MATTARITTRIPKTLDAKLRRRSKLQGKPASDLVRDALTSYLDSDSEAPLVYRVNGKEIAAQRGSALEAFMKAGFVGTGRNLPPDLSTNKKYMEGFGLGRNKRSR